MALIRLNNQSISSVTALPSGITTGKVINTSRVIHTSSISITSGGTLVDTGLDHNYTASSTSNDLLHIIQCSWRQNDNGGNAGAITIYADDSSISELSRDDALGEWHQDNAWTDMKSSTITYMSDGVASTNSIKYSLYAKGSNFVLQGAVGKPIVWTILEIAN